jgi:predicted AlkP superfamily phosphohydrolase/phosphomutase
MDQLLAEVRAKMGNDPDTILMVISDHGFCNFRRGVNLNTWLEQESYRSLRGRGPALHAGPQPVRWEESRAR